MESNQKKLRQMKTERRRGFLMYLLYINKPEMLDFASIITLMDTYNYPMTSRRLAEEIDFLRQANLVRVVPHCSDQTPTDAAQEKLIHRFIESDGETGDEICARISNNGVNFQEGAFEVVGVKRVN